MNAGQAAGRGATLRRPGSGMLDFAVLGWLLVPVVPLLVWAAASRWSAPAVLPQEWGLEGWQRAYDDGLGSALVRSTALGLAVAAIATPLGAMAGRALGWRELRRPAPVALALLAPVVLPPFSVAMGLDVLLLRVGLPEVVAVVLLLVVLALPYTSYTMRAAYAGIDPELEEQARTLGASPRQARRRATLPAVRLGLLTAAGLAFLVGWSDYVVTLLVGGGRLVTVPVLIGSTAAGSGNEATVAALSLSSVLPLVVVIGLTVALDRRRRGTP